MTRLATLDARRASIGVGHVVRVPRRLRNRRERGPAGSIVIGLLIGTFGLTLLANNLGWADAHRFMQQFWPFLLMAAGVGLLFIRTQGQQQSASGFWGIVPDRRRPVGLRGATRLDPRQFLGRVRPDAARTARRRPSSGAPSIIRARIDAAGCVHPHVRRHVRQRAQAHGEAVPGRGPRPP